MKLKKTIFKSWNAFGLIVSAFLMLALLAASCARTEPPTGPGTKTQPTQPTALEAKIQSPTTTPAPAIRLRGLIKIDGSSTVFPITEAVAEEFQKLHSDVKVTVGISGTGGGFKKFVVGETDISDASRSIKASEAELAQKNGIEWIELPVAFDGLSVIVNPQNTWVDFLSAEELKEIWEPSSTVTRWNQVRATWPDQPINLYGPGTDSGTFDYFTEAINGKEKASRSDYTASEDDNILVQGVAGDRNALGYFGYAYYVENRNKLKLVPVLAKGATSPVLPSETTVANGTYQLLSRPLFIYVNKKSAEKPELREFVRFYLSKKGRPLVKEVGYIQLPDRAYELALSRFESGKTGSLFQGTTIGVRIEDILARE